MISAPVFCRDFIGRAEELQMVTSACRHAAEGRGAVLLVGGDAGIGKTRFLSEACDALAGTMRFVQAQCFEHVQSPLGPFVEILHELDAGPIETGGDRLAQFVAIAESLRRAGEREPLFVAIEDIHWADLATLSCLQYLATKIATAKVVLFLTFRTDELHRTHALTPVVSKLERAKNARRIDLRALTEHEMRSFVQSALEGHRQVDEDTIRDVVTLAEGSPLFTEELLKHAVESGANGHTELPLSVRAAVLDRCSSLDDDERAILTQAAVFGKYFEPAFLADLTGRTREKIVATLRKARDLQLILEAPGNELQFAFRHALVREALHSELLTAEVRPLHVRIAEHLESQHETHEHVQQLAYHWWAARIGDKAAACNERAGDLALERLAYEDAAKHYERAIEFAPDGSREQAVLYEKLGHAFRVNAHADRARRAFEQALRHYRFVNDWHKTVELMHHIARAYWLLADAQTALKWRLDTLELARERRNDNLYFAALVNLANFHALAGRLDDALPYLEEAKTFAGAKDPNDEQSFYNACALVEALRGDFAASAEESAKAFAVAPAIADAERRPISHFNLGFVATTFAQFAIGTSAFEKAIVEARAMRSYSSESYALAGLSALQFFAGDYREARASIERALQEESDPGVLLQIQLAGVALPLGLRTGDVNFGQRFLREDLIESAFRSREDQRILSIASAMSEWCADNGDLRRARELVRRALASLNACSKPWVAVPFCLYGDAKDRALVRSRTAAWAAHPDNACGKAFLALVDALVAQAAGEDVREPAQHAATAFRALGLPYEEAVALELLERPDDALAIYERIGDLRDAKRLRAAVVGTNKRGRIKNELTGREREIAQLVASGKSNRAIASALVISERTVENHLASIFSKLGVASRTELAAKIASGAPS